MTTNIGDIRYTKPNNRIVLSEINHLYYTYASKRGDLVRHIIIHEKELSDRGIFKDLFSRETFVLVFSDGKEFGCHNLGNRHDVDSQGNTVKRRSIMYQFGSWEDHNYLEILDKVTTI